ncbi:MAG: RecB family exonuclease, partial [Acidimicrobiia bacterium]
MGLSYPRSLSPSAVSSFKDCPLAFRFSYVDRLPEPPSPWTTKGTLVHKALELLMLRPPADRTVEAALADLDQSRLFFADDPEFTELELSTEEWDAFHADAAEHVRRYFQLEDPR